MPITHVYPGADVETSLTNVLTCNTVQEDAPGLVVLWGIWLTINWKCVAVFMASKSTPKMQAGWSSWFDSGFKMFSSQTFPPWSAESEVWGQTLSNSQNRVCVKALRGCVLLCSEMLSKDVYFQWVIKGTAVQNIFFSCLWHSTGKESKTKCTSLDLVTQTPLYGWNTFKPTTGLTLDFKGGLFLTMSGVFFIVPFIFLFQMRTKRIFCCCGDTRCTPASTYEPLGTFVSHLRPACLMYSSPHPAILATLLSNCKSRVHTSTPTEGR